MLIASIMEEYSKGAWCEIVERCHDAGVDAFELNFFRPHGLPERKMGAAMGQDPAMVLSDAEWDGDDFVKQSDALAAREGE